MKSLAKLGLALNLLLLVSLNTTTAQQYSGYPGDDPVWISQQPNITLSPASLALILPPSLDNSALPFYPKENYTNIHYKFNQKTSNACVVAAMTFYAFTFEINRLRNADGQYPENKYSVNSLYNHMNDGTNSSTSTIEGTQLMMKENGVMNSSDWGNLDINDSVRWPSGYDLYENALDNRITGVSKIEMSQQGNNLAAIDVVKHYLYDHGNGESTGGLLNLPVFYWCHPDHYLPSQSAHTGDKIKIDISSCGETGHMVTIVGYDNNVKYDWGGAFTQNGDPMPDGIFSNNNDNNGDGEINLLDWEIGGFKIADNYGNQGNDGFYWILYRNLYNATLWAINPIEQYQPVLYLKIKANHWQRDLMRLGTGISALANDPVPPTSNLGIDFKASRGYFNDGGAYPLQGVFYQTITRNYDPMEFMIDFGKYHSLTNLGKIYFYSKSNATASNYLINNLSLVDYRWNEEFELAAEVEDVQIPTSTWTADNFVTIEYDLIAEGPQAPAITQNTTFSSNMVSRFTPTVSNNADLTVAAGVKIDMYNSDILINQGSELILEDGAIIRARRGYNTLTIHGNISVGFDVQFIADEGARLDIYLYNPNGTAEFYNSVFENTYLVSTINNLYLNGCAMTGGNISGSGGNITLSGCSFTDAQLFAYFANAKTNFVDISECSFTGSEDLYNAIELESYSTYSIQDCQIDNYGGTGIALMNCGDNAIENRFLTGNTIKHTGLTEDWSAGVLVYNSYAKIHDNEEIASNAYGIQSLDNSQVSIKGNSAATYSNGTQQIKNNTFNQVYATQGAFPYYFRYNTVLDEDNSCLVYYDLIYEGVVDVRGNYWGPSFVASEDLCPDLDYYNYKPVWPLIYVPLGDGPDMLLFESAQAKVETGDYSGAETDYKNVVSQYPESDYALSSMKELLALEKSTDADFATLKAYYTTLTTTEEIERLAGYLANTCDIELQNWPDAIAWLENVIDNPSSYPDSLFAIIDLETVYQKMQNTGLKSSYVGRYPEFRKNSVAEFKKSRNYYLSLLFKRDNASNTNMSEPKLNKLSVSPNPVVDFMALTYNIENNADTRIIIYNSIGSKIFEASNLPNNTGINNYQLNLSDYPTGVYVCTLWINNKCVDDLKFIKK